MSDSPLPPASQGRSGGGVPPAPRRPRSGWAVFGVVVAVLLVLAGLALVAFYVLLIVGLSQWGSNK
ncbi:hypothetical protein [Phaeacidiphilus oryzae]|uniref:hypothetical protein n=1 Tax=Phaeacidiphilus oryzae TaxID=348818 RepID=UPI0005629AC4|nr:hypothetical protein [Phaeacidiphilus oryzae]